MEMRTALFYAPQDIRIEKRPVPKPGPGEVLVKNKVALTCGTDVKTYLRGYPLFEPPFPFGHEAAGVVAEVGEGVKGFSVGDRVVAHNSAPCNRCYYCKKGQHSLCDNLKFNMGAFSEYQIIPAEIVEQNLYKIPEGVSYKSAALMEPLSTVVHGVEEAGIKLGDTVVVNGAGPIGLMFVKLASIRGARVIVTDMSDKRLEMARKLGADVTINVKNVSDQVRAVIDVTEDKRGADIAIEAVGLPETWEKTVLMARKGGTVLLFGGPKAGTTISLDTKLIHYSQLTLKGVFHTTPKYVKVAFDLISRGIINEEIFVSREYRLEQLEEAILSHKSGESIKNAIVFD